MAGIYDDQFVENLRLGVKAIACRWGASSNADVQLLTLSENATFILRDELLRKPLIIRVHRPAYHSKQEIESELGWILSLKASQLLTTPAPLAMTDGELIASFEDQGQTRYVVAFEFFPGKEPSQQDDLCAGFKTLGAISARLHLHSLKWQRPDNFRRKRWDFDSAFGQQPLWGDWRAAPGITDTNSPILERMLAKLQQRLSQYGDGPDRFGLIHADLRLANLLLQGDDLAVIDFDDCGFSWFMYDFAAAISFFEDSPQIPALQQAWLDGYRSVTPLAAEHEAMLPDLIMFRRMLLTAWVGSHPETETAAEAGHERFTEGTVKLAQKYLATADDSPMTSHEATRAEG